MPDHETASSNDDRGDLVHRFNDNITVVAVLRPGRNLRRRSRSKAVLGDVATSGGRLAVLLDRQPHPLLRAPDDPNIPLLYPNLDKGLA
ncbi:hypothetical protein KPH14_006353 [Odynerus spinipes]|uniref:Uncharacterized protein n=1 Tax=Odynerus spinipes TaxID=1348599 RepID=A0AAD9RZ39_9HYME|nr:hypothetical protein KPH14_006353 [Odynerus spinipes]